MTESFIDELAAVGARPLAILLLDCAAGNADLLSRLRLMVAAYKGRDALGTALERGIRALVEERTFYAWDEAATLAGRIDDLRRGILDGFLDWAPVTAATLLGSLVETSGTVMERVDDSSGSVGDAYGEAITAWGAAWVAVGPRDHEGLAAVVRHEIATDDYGVKRTILTAFQEALGPRGLVELRRLIQAELDREPAASDYRRGVWHHALQDVADALGDVDGFILAVQATGSADRQGIEVAERLVAAGRPTEALAWLDRAAPIGRAADRAPDVRIAAMLALGHVEAAQNIRWHEATERLRVDQFRAYLEALPVADREATRQQAVVTALSHGDANAALEFLVGLPDTAAAESLVVTRARDIDGRAYDQLRPLADVLEDAQPLAAVLLTRVLAEAILDTRHSPAYHLAARYIRKAEHLAGRVTDWRGHESHPEFMARLRDVHRRKSAFWPALAAAEREAITVSRQGCWVPE